jgi:hypothetical protein
MLVASWAISSCLLVFVVSASWRADVSAGSDCFTVRAVTGSHNSRKRHLGMLVGAATEGVVGGSGASASALSFEEWFRSYDRLASKSLLPEPDRRALAQLLYAAAKRPLGFDQRKEAVQLLRRSAQHYEHLRTELEKLPKMAETEDLRVAFCAYLLASAALCVDTETYLDEIATTDASGSHPILSFLLERAAIVDEIHQDCSIVECAVRLCRYRSSGDEKIVESSRHVQ